jgi:hypothetical protein
MNTVESLALIKKAIDGYCEDSISGSDNTSERIELFEAWHTLAALDFEIQTPEQKQEQAYIESEGSRCLVCFYKTIEADAVIIEGGSAYQKMNCLECGATWTDGYTLDRVIDPEAGNLTKAELIAMGFASQETGGGCEAFVKSYESKEDGLVYLMITDEDSPSIRMDTEFCNIGIYDDRTGHALYSEPFKVRWSTVAKLARVLSANTVPNIMAVD